MPEQKQSNGKIFLIGILALIVVLAIPARVGWAGVEPQTVPTLKPTARATLAPTRKPPSGDQPTSTPVAETSLPTATLQPSASPTAIQQSQTPRVFPTLVMNTLPTIEITSTPAQKQPTAAAVAENSKSEKAALKTTPWLCSGGLMALIPLLGFGLFFLRRLH